MHPTATRLLLLAQHDTPFLHRLQHALTVGGQAEWHFARTTSPEAALQAILDADPHAVVLADPAAWPDTTLLRAANRPLLAIDHTADQASADAARPTFAALLCPDPTLLPRNPAILPVPRPSPPTRTTPAPAPPLFTAGSYGGPEHAAGFLHLCRLMNAQFDHARIRILAPGAGPELEAACRAALTHPGLELEFITTPHDEPALLDLLATNSVNAFLDPDPDSADTALCDRIDVALACGRPIAIGAAHRFRHLHAANPSILATERALADIAGSGTAPLRALAAQSAPNDAAAAWEAAIATVLTRPTLPGKRPFNGPLRSGLDLAFVIDAVPRLLEGLHAPRLAAFGHGHEPAITALQDRGWRLTIPNPTTPPSTFDLVLALDVAEHLLADDSVLPEITALLAPGAAALLTLDLTRGHLDPQSLRHRLLHAAPDCALIDPDTWDTGRISCVLRKFPPHTLRRLPPPTPRSPVPPTPFATLRHHGAVHTRMHTQLGTETREHGLRLFTADGTRTGFLLFGPYTPLPAGRYECTFALRLAPPASDLPPDTPLLTIDTALERVEGPPLRHILRSDLTPGEFTFITTPFTLPTAVEAAEMRLHLTHPTSLTTPAAVALRRIEP